MVYFHKGVGTSHEVLDLIEDNSQSISVKELVLPDE